jgi:hypothetical protein
MPSVRPTTKFFLAPFLLAMITLMGLSTHAQENSPYSRYGLGDLIPAQNILNRGMGGISSAYADVQSINFSNPASYAEIKLTTFDIGLDYNSRTLMSGIPPKKFASAYLIPSYLQIGLPISKKRHVGMNIGLRPISRINYDIISSTRTEIDSVQYNYKGSGGTYQAFTGIGFAIKSLRVGLNAGYMFGNKQYNTRLAFVNDSIDYKKTNSSDTTRFGGLFFNVGLQYRIRLNSKTVLRLGLNGNIQNTMKAKRDVTRETYLNDINVGVVTLDSVYTNRNEEGTIIYPASWNAGFVIARGENLIFGGELNLGNWNNYRYYGASDNMRKSWTVRFGAQITPSLTSSNYWKRVAYRVGTSFGPDNIKITKTIPQKMFSFGLGLPVRRNPYTNQYSSVNTSFEFGLKGNKSNDIKENIFRLSLGLNLSDVWFNKPKYQ